MRRPATPALLTAVTLLAAFGFNAEGGAGPSPASAPGAPKNSGPSPLAKSPAPAAAVLASPLAPLERQPVREAVAATLKAGGFVVKELTFDDLCVPGVLSPANFDLLVLPDTHAIPGPAAAELERYLTRGGKMILIGGHPFQEWAVKSGAQWLDAAGIKKARQTIKPSSMIADFDSAQIGPWKINSSDRNPADAIARQTPGADGTAGCAKVSIADQKGWMTVQLEPEKPPFPAGQTLTCFWAKGDPNTPKLSVAWREKDGSRWIGVVDITTEWRCYGMAPKDFKFWGQGSPKSRGKAGDAFHPADAASFSIGLSNSHTGPAPGPHAFWFDQLGGAPASLLPESQNIELALPGLSPWYCLYPIQSPARMAPVSPIAAGADADALPAPKNVFCPVPRCKGQGFLNDPPYRWIPLAGAYDASGHLLGYPVSMLVNLSGPRRMSSWAAFTFDDAQAWNNPALRALLTQTARTLTAGAALAEAGSEFMAYYPGETVRLGARVANPGRQPASLTVALKAVPKSGLPEGTSAASAQQSAFEQSIPLTVAPGQENSVSIDWPARALDPSGYRVACELRSGETTLDSIVHEFSVLEPRGQFDPASSVTVKDGLFHLNGKIWRPAGVNYNPLYYAATPIKEWKFNWLTPGFYQPGVIEEDLRLVSSLGLNSLSIQTLDEPDPKAMRNLQDLLRRAQTHGLKVNVFLRAAEPMNLRPDLLRSIVEGAGLADNEAVFAYDISWEPKFGGKKDKKDITKYDAAWAKWIVERYGSVENAEKDWACPVPRAEGKITAPPNNQLLEDGPWRTMAIAYRRFMNDYISARFRDSTTLLRSLDPYHLISFRSGSAAAGGNPARGDLPYDFAAVAKACDFLCPEGWSLKKTPQATRFPVAYCRMVAPRKPVMWAEFGYSAWKKGERQTDAQGLVAMRDLCKDYYEMFLQSGSQGGMIWRWTGWYRVEEQSDFGVCGQDRLPRPIWDAIKTYVPRLEAAPSPAEPNAWIAIDPGASPAGYAQVFRDKSNELVALYDEGKIPGLRTEATGKNSADAPLVAVGNKPCTGANPPKHLNAEFNWIKIEDASGKMVEAKDGATIQVASNAPIHAEASIGNISPVEWLAPAKHQGPGAVYLSSRLKGGLAFEQPIPDDTPSLQDAVIGRFVLTQGLAQPAELEFEMTAKDRAWFGEKIHFTLKPSSQ